MSPAMTTLLRSGDIDLLVFFFCTWVAEEITLALARDLAEIPLLLWALPYLDESIPMPSPMTGLTATGCNIRRLGRSFLHRVGAPTPETVRAVARTAEIAAVVKGLRQARFGIVGSTCPGMIDSGCDESLLQKCLGVTTVRRDLDNLLRARDASSPEEARRLASDLVSRVGTSEVDLATIAEQYRLYLGAKSMVEADHLDGFAARCWPELRDQHKVGICLAKAELSESGIPTACEADLTALVTCHILTRLTGEPSYSLEVTGYLEPQQALQLAHCGSAALSLGRRPRQGGNPRPHENRNRSADRVRAKAGHRNHSKTPASLRRPSQAIRRPRRSNPKRPRNPRKRGHGKGGAIARHLSGHNATRGGGAPPGSSLWRLDRRPGPIRKPGGNRSNRRPSPQQLRPTLGPRRSKFRQRFPKPSVSPTPRQSRNPDRQGGDS